MTISDYIQSIVSECLPDATFQYGRNTDFNINGDDVASPAVLVIEPDQQYLNLNATSGNVYDGYNLFMRFLQLIPQIGTAEQAPTRVAAITAQKANAALFLSQLSEDDNFIDIPAQTPLIPVIEAYDGNWFGVEINIRNLQVLRPFDVCV